MKISLKSKRDLELMRAAGRLVHRALSRAKELAKAGMTTLELDRIVYDTYTSAGGQGLFKWYPTYEAGKGFPGNTCISVNDEVVHGIPSERMLKDGDIVSVDCGIRLGGFCGDSAVTLLIGNVSPEAKRLCEVTQETLAIAVREIRPGRRWSDVAAKMQEHVEANGMSCVREFVGHGIGARMHEDPKVPNFVSGDFLKRGDFYLQPGMTLAVEPMVILGKPDVVVLDDRWTVVTKDSTPAAHYEHTIAVTATGSDVLTDGR
ncbi:MAG TPA: type I methionyl aminopeptidase [Phycisphaerae bacterium]|jgi:methionyl aminopeptidase|nr:type I methionyl aminopeptidase [Phycisphaerae bacterium]